MLVVHKYLLQAFGSRRRNVRLLLPLYAKVLSVHKQQNSICLWVETNHVAGKYSLPEITTQQERIFACYMTGELIEADCELRFIGTVLLEDDSYVLHVYEKIGALPQSNT